MKNLRSFYLLFILVALTACSNTSEDIIEQTNSNQEYQIFTKSGNFHWTCKSCGFALNGGWQNYCSKCRGAYQKPHGDFIYSVIMIAKEEIKTTITEPGPDKQKTIQLPNLTYPIYPPINWYDTPKSQSFYNNLKTLYYSTNATYREGVDLGWYRTTQSLYPQNTFPADVKRLYDRLIISGGLAGGTFESGLKEGTKAAIDAFTVYR
ncbi:MAG: hypothetical protein ACRCTQ_02845 [Brevinemataceae bacterium]